MYDQLGGFDEIYRFNGEDAAYGFYLASHGVRMKYIPEMNVEHPPILALSDFIRWHYKRGVGNYYMKKRLGKVKHLVGLRIWSSINLIKAYYRDWKFPVIFFLLALMPSCLSKDLSSSRPNIKP